MRIRNTIVGLFFIPFMVFADTPPPGTVKAKIEDGAGTPITSTLNSGKQSIDVNITNPGGGSTVTANQGTPNGGGANAWWVQGSLGRTWNLLNTTDSVNVGNFPASFGRTWNLSSGADSVSSAQSGTWNTGRTWTLNSGSDSVTITGSITATNSANGNTGSAVPAQATQVAGSDGTNLRALKVSSTGVLSVDGSAVTQPVSGSVSVSNFPATQQVSQSATPWVENLTQLNGASPSATNYLPSRITNGIAYVDPTQIRALSSGTDSVAISASSLPLPAGAATSALQTTGNSSLSSIDTKIPSGLTVTSTRLLVDGSGVTQPISAASLPLPAGASTSALQTSGNSSLTSIDSKTPALGQTTMSGSVPVAIASDQNLSTGAIRTTSGSITAQCTTPSSCAAGTTVAINTAGAQSITVSVSGTFVETLRLEATNDGGANWQAIVGFNPNTVAGSTDITSAGTMLIAPAVATQMRLRCVSFTSGSASANLTVSLSTTPFAYVIPAGNVTVLGNIASGSADAGNPVKVGGRFNSTPITLLDGQRGDIQLTSNGSLKVDGSAVTQPISAASLPLPAGAATSANQTNASQKTQVVDGSGSVVGPLVTISGTNYMPVIQSSSATPGSAVPARSTVVAGSDGTNAQTLSTDATGKLNINISGDPDSGSTGSAVPAKASYIAGINAGNLIGLSVDASGRLNTNTFDGAGNSTTSTTFNAKTGLSNVISGQDILTVTGSGAALNGDAIAATDVAAYSSISLQIVVAGTNTTTFQGSNDNFTNTFTVACTNTVNGTASPVTTTAATGLFRCPKSYRYFRARVTAFTSGSSSGTAIFSPMPDTNDVSQRSVSAVQSGAWTVSSNPAVQTFSTQVASGAKVASGNSGTLTQATPNNNAILEVNVTAVSGTTPTLDLVFQESYDGGTTWTDEWHWERITAATQISTPNLAIGTAKWRFVWTIGGTTPSFTFSIGSTQGSVQGSTFRRFFDRTISLNTLNSTTASFNGDGCRAYSFTINQSACTTFPTVAIATSEDGVNFATTSTVLATTANGTFQSAAMTAPSRFIELITTTVGTTCTLGYAALRCTQY